MESNKECHICSEEFHRFRSSISHCSQCDYSLCSECLSIHRLKHEQERSEIQHRYNDLIDQINEKEKYINETSQDSIEILVNWYQRLINDLIESQTQLIEKIQNERDRARDELAQFDSSAQRLQTEIEQINERTNIQDIQSKLNDLTKKLSSYQITKDLHLPNSHTLQPRYKISYQFKDASVEEEDWDVETNEATTIPLPYTPSTGLFFSDTSQTFVTPKGDEDEDDFQWCDALEQQEENHSEYFLDPNLYHLGTPRHFNSDIHLIASNGTDLLYCHRCITCSKCLQIVFSRCYSRQTKQLIFVGDGNVNPLVLQWYHGHILQLVWSDNLKAFVTVTDNDRYEIYTIESTSNFRLKIRLRTCLPPPTIDMIKDRIFLRADDDHVFIYYERIDGRKRLRLLNSAVECVQSYAIDRCLQREEHVRSGDNGLVIGLGVNQEYVVLFVRSMEEDNLAGQAAASLEDTRLLVFKKSTMSFIRRVILSDQRYSSPLIVHFLNLSSFILIDQVHHTLRFYQYEKQIGQISLLSSSTSSMFNSTTTSNMNMDCQYSSIVLMNDGSIVLSNDRRNLIQLILNDQSNDLDDW